MGWLALKCSLITFFAWNYGLVKFWYKLCVLLLFGLQATRSRGFTDWSWIGKPGLKVEPLLLWTLLLGLTKHYRNHGLKQNECLTNVFWLSKSWFQAQWSPRPFFLATLLQLEFRNLSRIVSMQTMVLISLVGNLSLATRPCGLQSDIQWSHAIY